MKAIYIICNKIDSRVYIGSAVNVNIRFYHHKRDLRLNKHHNSHLQNFYNKYGKDYLTYSILEKVKNKPDLIKREQFYINLYPKKFNICIVAGNSLNRVCSQETKFKISESLKKAGLKGILKSEETKLKMRKPKTKEHALKIKQAQKNTRKKVYQYDLENNLLAEFESTKQAASILKIDRRQISAVCNNNQKTCNGYKFKFNKL